MAQSKPSITSTKHILPFDRLSPRDFERLCLWLVERQGYERAEHLGAAGSEQGRDIIAWREGKLWAFQCKRVRSFGPSDALKEADKVLGLPKDQRPVGLVFLVTCDVSADTRQQTRERCAGEMECYFWAGTELDEKVKRYLDIVKEFFQADQGATIVTGDIVFQTFAQTPMLLSNHIRLREFQTLINERTRKFVGRDFVFKAINDLLKSPNFPSGYIVISGEPGIGKTTLLAQLVKLRGYVHHFNICTQNIRSTQDFLANLCAQLVVRYELEHFMLPSEATQDSGFLSRLLSEVAEKERDQPVIILVDALDEAEDIGLAPGANRLYLPPALPDGVFFVVTTRPKVDYRLFVDRRKDIYLRDEDPCNLQDVRLYIQDFLKEHWAPMALRVEQWGLEEEEFVDVITEKSEGNFMYLVYVLGDIRDGRLTATNIDDIRNLPQGLQDYYQHHWRSMRAPDPDRFDKYYEAVVCILAAVREPVTISQVVEWTKLSPVRVKEVIGEWREFLNVHEVKQGESLYRVYHTSFQDFLQEEVGLTRYHDMIAQRALDKIPGFSDKIE
jgi:hypothetical protein